MHSFNPHHLLGSLARRDLYKEGVRGQPELIGSLQLLYWVYYSNWTEVSKLLQLLLPFKDHPDMQHALKVNVPLSYRLLLDSGGCDAVLLLSSSACFFDCFLGAGGDKPGQLGTACISA